MSSTSSRACRRWRSREPGRRQATRRDARQPFSGSIRGRASPHRGGSRAPGPAPRTDRSRRVAVLPRLLGPCRRQVDDRPSQVDSSSRGARRRPIARPTPAQAASPGCECDRSVSRSADRLKRRGSASPRSWVVPRTCSAKRRPTWRGTRQRWSTPGFRVSDRLGDPRLRSAQLDGYLDRIVDTEFAHPRASTATADRPHVVVARVRGGDVEQPRRTRRS